MGNVTSGFYPPKIKISFKEKKNKYYPFKIKFSKLDEEIINMNLKLSKIYLDINGIDLTIDFGNKNKIPDGFKIDLSYNFNLTIEGKYLTHIGHLFLSKNPTLKKITLPANIASVGKFFLYNCTSLDEITLPDSISHVMDNFLIGKIAIKI